MIRNFHNALAIFGKKIAQFTLTSFGLILHLFPFLALCGSLYLGAVILDFAGIGLIWGSPILILWFVFVCFYVADHVQPPVAEAATKLVS